MSNINCYLRNILMFTIKTLILVGILLLIKILLLFILIKYNNNYNKAHKQKNIKITT
jgi:hypothetical protein